MNMLQYIRCHCTLLTCRKMNKKLIKNEKNVDFVCVIYECEVFLLWQYHGLMIWISYV